MRLLDMLCVRACCRFSVVVVLDVPYFFFWGGGVAQVWTYGLHQTKTKKKFLVKQQSSK